MRNPIHKIWLESHLVHKGFRCGFAISATQAQTIVTMKDTDFSWICSDRWGTDRSVVLNGPVESMDLWQGEKDECRIWGVYICIPFVYRLYTVWYRLSIPHSWDDRRRILYFHRAKLGLVAEGTEFCSLAAGASTPTCTCKQGFSGCQHGAGWIRDCNMAISINGYPQMDSLQWKSLSYGWVGVPLFQETSIYLHMIIWQC